MSFFEDIIIDLGREILYNSFKWFGVFIKWIFYLGKTPISKIKAENWNTRIGLILFFLIIGIIIYFKK